jgi:hypothetical protein
MLSIVAATAILAKQPFHFVATFIECCSCKDVCVTEITGRDAGCRGLGAIHFESGSYGGKNLAGTAAAFAWDSGKWVRIYVDAPAGKSAGVTSFMKAMLADWGKLEPVHTGSVRISHSGGRYALLVDKGHTGSIEMKPVLGGDGKTPVSHTNLSSPVHSTLMQGATLGASFSGEHPFELKDSNGFFNMHCVMEGKL